MILFGEERILLQDSINEKNSILEKEELYTGEYINNKTNPHTEFIEKMILKCEDCIDSVNQTSGIIPNIVDSYKDGVGIPQTSIDLDFREIAHNIILFKRVGIEISKEGKEYNFSVVPADEISIENGVIIRAVNYEYYDIEKDAKRYFTLKREYYNGYTLNFLYEKINNSSVLGKKISLNKLSDLGIIEDGLELKEKELNNINGESLVIIDNKYNNINNIISLVYMIEKIMVSVDKELLLLTPQKILFKGIKIKDEDIKKDNWFTDNQEASIDVISRTNEYIGLDWEVIKDKLRMISAISKLPLEDLGFSTSGSIGLQAQKARRHRFESLITNLRIIIENGVNEALSRAGIKKNEDTYLLWGNIGYTDEKESIENIKLAKDSGLMNDTEALMKYWGITKEEAEKKIK